MKVKKLQPRRRPHEKVGISLIPQSSKIMNLTNITLVLEKAILNKITTYLVEQVFCTHVKGALHRLHLLLNVTHLPFLENSIKNLRSNS